MAGPGQGPWGPGPCSRDGRQPRLPERRSLRCCCLNIRTRNGIAATMAICIVAPTLIRWSPPGSPEAQIVRQATLIIIQAKTTAARLPRGLGYSMRLTISQATPRMPAMASGFGWKSSTMETTVIAPMGMGNPMKSPLFVFTQANRASRTTPASTTDPATLSTSQSGRLAEKPAQSTTMNAGANPKLITSARLSSSAPMAEARNFRATRPSNRSQVAPMRSRTTAVPKNRGSGVNSAFARRALIADQASTPTARKPQSALPRESEAAAAGRKALPTGPWDPSPTSPTGQVDSACRSGAVKARHARHRPLTHRDRRGDALRQVDVDPGAEPDQPDPLPLRDLGARREVRHDAAGERAGDLHDLQLPEGGGELPDHPLVLVAVLVEGRQEATGDVLDRGHDPVGRGAVDVHVQRAHEYRHPGPAVRPWIDALHDAVGRGQQPSLPQGALGVAEEPEHGAGEGGERYGRQRPPGRATGQQGRGDRRGGGRNQPRGHSAREPDTRQGTCRGPRRQRRIAGKRFIGHREPL